MPSPPIVGDERRYVGGSSVRMSGVRQLTPISRDAVSPYLVWSDFKETWYNSEVK